MIYSKSLAHHVLHAILKIILETENWKVLLILKNILRTKTRGFKMLKAL
jgi:lipopolysaccharide biosynthesis protein